MKYLLLLLGFWVTVVTAQDVDQLAPYIMPGPAYDYEGISPLDTFSLADDLLIPYLREGKFGFVNKDKEMLLDPQWEFATPIIDNRGTVTQQVSEYQQSVALIDRAGRTYSDFKYSELSRTAHPGHWLARMPNWKAGVIDSMGNVIIPVAFMWLNYIPESKAYLAQFTHGTDKGGKGFIDAQNNIVIDLVWDEIVYSEHFYKMKKDGKYALYNRHLEEVLPLVYDNMYTVQDGLLYVQQGDKKMIIDTLGHEVLDVSEYYYASYYNRNAVWTTVKKGESMYDKYRGMLDLQTGEVIVPHTYRFGSEFKNGLMVIQDTLGNHGLVNDKGEFVVVPEHKFLLCQDNLYFGRTKASTPTGWKWFIMDNQGSIIYASELDVNFAQIEENNFVLTIDQYDGKPNGLIEKWGKKIIFPPQFDEIHDRGLGNTGLIKVKVGEESYYVDVLGNRYRD
ncbi:hypothetical protein BFP72_10495 [Reichenbachiella sp. 5M10]|uniref:WG repeat-containing protein n=1 Tax=Reichenbachiella sp. 5M10 TaxID=1889772 RepID=UPI000C14AE93|nr:WG repeat-containing protein [Reichenbachiella sp. 5M10]PIB35792.1 hypothetical protein BFP72_10495 [Reichenbachiella sp. 5M10]